MAMTLLEKIIAAHSKTDNVQPGQIIDVEIDMRVARDFGGANVIKHIMDYGLTIDDTAKTLFTFDCNPSGSDQKYAVNQQKCRVFARENRIRLFDIDAGIGTHILIDEGFVTPGSTAVSTDSHANILGSIGAFGQGMGDMDIASAWNKGKVWFRVPASVKINFIGKRPPEVSAKDIILNLLNMFGANSLLGYSVELYGESVEKLTLDERITISSMATEMGAIIILIPPSKEIIDLCHGNSKRDFMVPFADNDARYEKTIDIDITRFEQMVSLPGEPHNTVAIGLAAGKKIDSAFIGSCTNGRMEDMRKAADILKGRKVAPDVVLKIVPATDRIWKRCLEEGIIEIFKNAGALVSNAGCAGCSAGQVGQNGPGEVTISTGNRNFPGKQGKGDVYLSSPSIVAASAVAGCITTPDKISLKPAPFDHHLRKPSPVEKQINHKKVADTPDIIEGRIWVIQKDNIDTDMIYHNSHLTVTDIKEMGQYTFGNLDGYFDFASKVKPGDIIVAGKNFGSGSSRQQAVDCFISLGVKGIIAESFGAIYERNAINAAFPIISCKSLNDIDLNDEDIIKINIITGEITNIGNGLKTSAEPFSEVQSEIYRRGGLLG